MTNNSQITTIDRQSTDQYLSAAGENSQHRTELFIKIGAITSVVVAACSVMVALATYIRLPSKDFLIKQEEQIIATMKANVDNKIQQDICAAQKKTKQKTDALLTDYEGKKKWQLRLIKDTNLDARDIGAEEEELREAINIHSSEAKYWEDSEADNHAKSLLLEQKIYDDELKALNDSFEAHKAKIAQLLHE